ncbi:uncharacterized protein LOC105842472 isoform X2 [Bombyx mori]|uniref:uncharacterized protein LOC105842472 isoform X2 n=1 Tax=Bombyx mori TaxID=7091 RepID=UPI000B3C941C
MKMKSISFADLTKQVNFINDMILSDMVCENADASEEALRFSRNLLITKNWFERLSWTSKKRYVLALLEDVRSAWTLSLLLKSIWNCRTKDSVMSISEKNVLSCYDQVPMDHNRTAIPVSTLAQAMKNNRVWFLSLEKEAQAIVLMELLIASGGPIMWTVLRRAQTLYDIYQHQKLKDLEECVLIKSPNVEKDKKEQSPASRVAGTPAPDKSQNVNTNPIEKELEENLAAWNATLKSMRENLKLEELEISLKDGTARKIWKVNRSKPETIETVDFVQLLPSAIAKRIFCYLPRNQLNDYARVNKYWAYLVDELRAELAARVKIDMDLAKMRDLMLRHDTSLEVLEVVKEPAARSSLGATSLAQSAKFKLLQSQPSVKASEKSAGVYSLRHFLSKKLKPAAIRQTPIRNMAELTERLNRRGAADENIWKWCKTITRDSRDKFKTGEKETTKKASNATKEGILELVNAHFPCPMMKKKLEVPLKTPLCKDPSLTTTSKNRRNLSQTALARNMPREEIHKRYSLWARDFSTSPK